MNYVLGIDGGGTKTVGVIANWNGEVVAEAKVGASNPNTVQKTELLHEFTQLIQLLQKQNNRALEEVSFVFAGLSGAGHESMKEMMAELIKSVLPHPIPVKVDDDAIIALYSGTLGLPGIVQISGTGSITYGVNASGKRERVGGWGHLFGEKGSGYAIGNEALQAAFAYHDGVGPNTILYEQLIDYFHIKALPDVIPQVYHSANMKEMVAAVTPLVLQARDAGDSVAKKIIEQNGLSIGASISSLIEYLFKSNSAAVNVVLAGGLFKRDGLFTPFIEQVLRQRNQQVNMILPQVPPAAGAIIAAYQATDHLVGGQFIPHFNKTIRNR